MMASYYTRSKAPRPSECSDVEPIDVAPVAATSSPTSDTVRPNVAAVGEPESMSTEPVSAHPSPTGRATFQGGPGVEGPAGSPLVGVSALRYPSGLAGPSELSAVSRGQQSTTTVGVGMVAPPPAALRLHAASQRLPTPTPTPTSRGLTLAPNVGPPSTRRTSRARSRSPPSSASYCSLSPPVLSPVYDVEQSQFVPVDRGRPRLQRQPSLLPYQPHLAMAYLVCLR